MLGAGSSGLWGGAAEPALVATPLMRRYERVLSELPGAAGAESAPPRHPVPLPIRSRCCWVPPLGHPREQGATHSPPGAHGGGGPLTATSSPHPSSKRPTTNPKMGGKK